MAGKVTLSDIAARVGVSKGLVSLALSDSDLVNEKTRAEIILTALRMGYNLDKRKIRKTRDKMFSLIVSDASYVNTFFWTEVVKGMETRMAESDIGLDLVVYNEHTVRDQMLLDLIDKKTNGLIMVSTCDKKRLDVFRQTGLPIVVVDGDSYYGTDADSVYASNYLSSYSAARYFLEKGHRDLAFVGSTNYSMSFRQRRDGFRDGASPRGERTVCREITGDGNKTYETFDSRKFRALMRSASPPTAVMCVNDYTAVGVYEILTKMGFRVPEDVSLIGFDDIKFDSEIIPRLTTFGINKSEFGRMAVDLLCERIENPEKPKKLIEIFAALVERGSVRDLNKTKEDK